MSLVSKGPPLSPEDAAELQAWLDRKPLKLNISREWFERMATLEGDLEVGAGSVSAPTLEQALDQIVSGYNVNHTSKWARDTAAQALAPSDGAFGRQGNLAGDTPPKSWELYI